MCLSASEKESEEKESTGTPCTFLPTTTG